jgi:hypothetical protein
MAKKNWTIQLEDGRHSVELDHGALSGKRRISLDGQVVEESQKTIDIGSQHTFPLDGHECTVVIRTNGFTFSYDLLLDGQPLEKRAARPKPPPKPKPKPKPKPAAPQPEDISPASPYQFSLSGFLSLYSPHLGLTILFAGLGLFGIIVGRARAANDLFIIGVVALAGSLGPLIPPIVASLKTVDAVDLGEHDIRWQDAAGSHSLTWQEVREVYRLEMRRNGFRVTELKLVPIAGEPVTFNHSLTQYDQLAEKAQMHHAAVWLATKRAEVETAGATFGPVTLLPDAVLAEGERLAWEEIEQYGLMRGYLCFLTRRLPGRAMQMVAAKDIPDYLLLLQLLEEFGKPAASAQVLFEQVQT